MEIRGFFSLIFNQAAFDHWAAGGENSISLTTIDNGFYNYHKGKNLWENTASITFGFIKTKSDNVIKKNSDLVILQSKYGHEIGKNLFATGLANIQTQFAKGYNPTYDSVNSQLFAPGYLLLSAGVEWKPFTYLSLYLSPITGKFTFVSNQYIADLLRAGQSLYGTTPAVYDTIDGVRTLVTHGKKSFAQFGALFTAEFKKDIFTNVNVDTKLSLFGPYNELNHIDIVYNLLINMKINKWLTAAFFTNVLYYNNVIVYDYNSDNVITGAGPRTQVQEGLGVGLTYKFGTQK